MVNVYTLNRNQFLGLLEQKATPLDIYLNAPRIYDYMAEIFNQNCVDNTLREWAFQWYCERTGEDYNAIYEEWLQLAE